MLKRGVVKIRLTCTHLQKGTTEKAQKKGKVSTCWKRKSPNTNKLANLPDADFLPLIFKGMAFSSTCPSAIKCKNTDHLLHMCSFTPCKNGT